MIRAAQKSDASRIAELLIFTKRTCYRGIFHDDDTSFRKMQVLPLALHYEQDADALSNVDVYDDNGIIKGMLRWEIDAVHLEAMLSELYVDAFFHGEHIGTSLLHHFEKKASDAGIKKIRLWCLEKNETAKVFYEKNGYVFWGTTKKEEGTEELLMQYEKDI